MSEGNSKPSPGSTGKSDFSPANISSTSNQTLCRNILIHGYCKYADKGCAFRHDTPNSSPTKPSSYVAPSFTVNEQLTNANSSIQKKKLNADSPAFTPTSYSLSSAPPPSSKSTLSAQAVESAPPFIPKNFTIPGGSATNGQKPSFNPENVFSPRPLSAQSNVTAGSSAGAASGSTSGFMSVNSPGMMHSAPNDPGSSSLMTDFNSLAVDPPQPPRPPIPLQAAGQDMMFQQPTTYPLQYHLYAPRPEINRFRLQPQQRTAEDYFVNDQLREELQRKNEASLQKFPQMMMPEFVHVYHSLFPLDTNSEKSTRMFGHATWVYRATSNNDGRIYCLRRIENYRLTNERAMGVVKHWEKVQSPSVVALREAFTSRAFSDHSLIFVYDFYPMSETLYDHHFGNSAQFNHHEYVRGFLREPILWNYITQILSGLRSIHKANLAARMIDPTRVLLTGQGRVRLNCVGVFDMLNYDTNNDYTLEDLQLQDIEGFGKLILGLACNSLNVGQTVEKGLETISQVYSKQLQDLLTYLLTPQDEPKTVSTIISMIADKYVDSMNGALINNDYIEGELSKELENGRLFRLLCKFGFINERPEFDRDPNWSESGDRYIIKLFRDYVFHQVDEANKPVVDMAHVLTCLNKLDAGIDEKLMLVSRDEQTCLIVTYKELKTCIQTAFRELTK